MLSIKLAWEVDPVLLAPQLVRKMAYRIGFGLLNDDSHELIAKGLTVEL